MGAWYLGLVGCVYICGCGYILTYTYKSNAITQGKKEKKEKSKDRVRCPPRLASSA